MDCPLSRRRWVLMATKWGRTMPEGGGAIRAPFRLCVGAGVELTRALAATRTGAWGLRALWCYGCYSSPCCVCVCLPHHGVARSPVPCFRGAAKLHCCGHVDGSVDSPVVVLCSSARRHLGAMRSLPSCLIALQGVVCSTQGPRLQVCEAFRVGFLLHGGVHPFMLQCPACSCLATGSAQATTRFGRDAPCRAVAWAACSAPPHHPRLHHASVGRP